MGINFKRTSVRFGQALAVAGVLTIVSTGMASAQSAVVKPLMTGTPPASEMGTNVAPHAETIYTLVPQLRSKLGNDYKNYLKPTTSSHAGFLYKVIDYNFDTLADTHYESSVVEANFKTTVKNNRSAQQHSLQAAAAVGVVLEANEYTVPVPSRVPTKNDATHSTTYYERDDSVVVVKVTNGNVSITADTRQGLWTSAGMTTSFVEQLIGGTQPMAHVKGDNTSSWWQGATRKGQTLVYSRPVFYGVGSHQEADMFIGTDQTNGHNYHFVQQDGQWKLAGSGHDQDFWRKTKH